MARHVGFFKLNARQLAVLQVLQRLDEHKFRRAMLILCQAYLE